MYMSVTKKIVIILGSFLVIGGLIIAGLLYFNSASYKVSQLENEWNINLPNGIKLEYDSKKVHIDGSIHYYVFTTTSELTETMFTIGDDISKDDFETSFISAMEGLGISSGKINIPSEFYPDLNENYKFILLNSVGGGGNRHKYFYLVYLPETKRIFICNQVSQ